MGGLTSSLSDLMIKLRVIFFNIWVYLNITSVLFFCFFLNVRQVTLCFVGVLAYFQAQLADIMAYADLQPKVFQYFREIGNAIIFTLHIEQHLVCVTIVLCLL